MFLESLCHSESSFATLTYSPEKVPKGGTLCLRDVQLFMKRLRKACSPLTVRYFVVGEYGPETERPHYHASLFGIGREFAPVVERAWGLGFTSLYEFNEKTAQYVAGYVLKKMTDKNDLRLEGRYPEFARMSLRPGIGAAAMAVVAEALHSDAGLDEIGRWGDVPMQLKLGTQSIPLGRYLRSRLQKEVGMPRRLIDESKKWFSLTRSGEVCDLLQNALWFGEDPTVTSRGALEASMAGRVVQVEARSKLFESRRAL